MVSTPRRQLEESYRHALRACDPGRLVAEHLPPEPPSLILALGKAALSMLKPARAAYRRGDQETVPWLASPPAATDDRPALETAELVSEGLAPGSHPLPGPGSVAAAGRALGLASRLTAGDTMLVLISGGGSALWCAPWGPLAGAGAAARGPAARGSAARGVDLEVKRTVTSVLQRAGADIHELNTVRRHLSRIKGGRLAEATAARVVTLALSDVPGDDLSDIASGPTVPDPTTFADALAVCERFAVGAPAALTHLRAGLAGDLPETPKPGGKVAERSDAKVIGSSPILLQAAADYWRELGYEVALLSAALQGEASSLAAAHADLIAALAGEGELRTPLSMLQPDAALATELSGLLERWRRQGEGAPPLVLLSGGEATVTVTGSGRGGRNLEFAGWLLARLRRLRSDLDVWALSAGSDGVDGSSAAAGAFLTPDSAARATAQGVDLEAYLGDNDSDGLFARLGDLFTPGPTGNNLNDYRAVVLSPRSRSGLS